MLVITQPVQAMELCTPSPYEFAVTSQASSQVITLGVVSQGSQLSVREAVTIQIPGVPVMVSVPTAPKPV